MRKLLLAACVVLVAAVPASGQTVGNEGCVVLPVASCEYVASHAGSIIAAGDWTVEVWWQGSCGAGAADYTRSSRPHEAHPASTGDNNVGGIAGTWEGSVAAGACARVTTGEGVALVGAVFADV